MDQRDAAAELVLERWRKGERELSEARRHYWMNVAFYDGHQWVVWDPNRNFVRNFAANEGPDATRVRLTINKIQERIDQLLGRMAQRNLVFEVLASESDDATIAGARLGESILEAGRRDQDWEAIREDSLFNCFMGGTSAVAVEWDGGAGEELWIDSRTRAVVGTGDVKLVPLSVAEFCVEPGSRRWRDARYWVGLTLAPPAQVKAHYNLDFLPEADGNGAYSPLQREMLSSRGHDVEDDLTCVYVMYERPNKLCEKGRRIAVVNGKAVVKGEWPFPWKDRLNIECFRQKKLPQRWYGSTIATAARGPQQAYNAVRSSIIETAKMAGNPRMMVPKGSLDEDTLLTDESGEIVEYWPEAGSNGPHYLEPPQLPRWLTAEPDRIEAELDGILYTHAVSRGVAPGDRNSGLALSILAEKNDTPLGPMARDQANGWGQLGSLVLKLYEAKAKETRKAVVHTDRKVPQVLEWNGEKLRGQTTVNVPLDATVPQSRMATQAMLTNLAGSFPAFGQGIDQSTLARLLDLPGQQALQDAMPADVQRAMFENDRLSAGEPVLPEKWHDHGRHIAEHNRFRNTSGWESLPDDVKELFELHLQGHQRYLEEEAVAQATLNAIQPGFAGLPQADAPLGSAVPPDFQTQQQMGAG